MTHYIHTSELAKLAPTLTTLDRVYLSGTVYTARDAAHKRILQAMQKGESLPFPLRGASIYYAGPTPAPEGLPIGSCGPTTSGRMDSFAPTLLDAGLTCMIGKGERNQAVKDAIVRNRAVYLCAIGGAGALACRCITACEVIAYEDLGCESVKRLEFDQFPLIVAVDSHGNDIFRQGRSAYTSL